MRRLKWRRPRSLSSQMLSALKRKSAKEQTRKDSWVTVWTPTKTPWGFSMSFKIAVQTRLVPFIKVGVSWAPSKRFDCHYCFLRVTTWLPLSNKRFAKSLNGFRENYSHQNELTTDIGLIAMLPWTFLNKHFPKALIRLLRVLDKHLLGSWHELLWVLDNGVVCSWWDGEESFDYQED